MKEAANFYYLGPVFLYFLINGGGGFEINGCQAGWPF